MSIQVETVSFGGWPHCQRVTNGVVEVVATTDVGPRLVGCGLVGGPNLFKAFAEHQGLTGGDEWRSYGGHRFWHAPEDLTRTYVPDNSAVPFAVLPDGLRLTQAVEAPTGLQKEIELKLWPGAARVRVTHRLRNHGLWAVETAPWALSVMAPGGTAILPLPPRGPHAENLLPKSHLVLWAYTDMSDPRWTWGEKYILLRQDPQRAAYQKIGASVPNGWAAYANGGQLFVKRVTYQRGEAYPDLGSSVETFTNAEFLELETLGPLSRIAPGAAVEHVEDWHVFDGVRAPANDADVEADVVPRVREAERQDK